MLTRASSSWARIPYLTSVSAESSARFPWRSPSASSWRRLTPVSWVRRMSRVEGLQVDELRRDVAGDVAAEERDVEPVSSSVLSESARFRRELAHPDLPASRREEVPRLVRLHELLFELDPRERQARPTGGVGTQRAVERRGGALREDRAAGRREEAVGVAEVEQDRLPERNVRVQVAEVDEPFAAHEAASLARVGGELTQPEVKGLGQQAPLELESLPPLVPHAEGHASLPRGTARWARRGSRRAGGRSGAARGPRRARAAAGGVDWGVP